MSFDITPNVQVTRDADGRVIALSHLQQPYLPAATLTRPTTSELAAAYVADVAGIFGFAGSALRAEDRPAAELAPAAGVELRLEEEKHLRGSAAVVYRQTYEGLPIWSATLQLHLTDENPRVTSSTSTLHTDPVFDEGDAALGRTTSAFDETAFTAAIGAGDRTVTMNGHRLLWYRYEPQDRLDPETALRAADAADSEYGFAPLEAPVPALPLASVFDGIQPGVHYLCWEVLFTLDLAGFSDLNWRALVEVDSGSVLYLRALTASASGCVFVHDPITQANASVNCASTNAALNALRTTIPTLEGLKPPVMGTQELSGDLIVVTDTDLPVDAPPTEGAPHAFCYDVKTSDFWAVNAYHHSDFVFRLVEGMGFPVANYFDGTTFPVPVDHNGWETVNAQAPGNVTGTGLQKFRFGWACPSGEVGIAADQRVVLHEFGHALLWDHVGSPNFGFAHSAGDALAAILHDPGTAAPDRYATFPWLTALNPGIDRRHDRDPNAGWAWFGSSWNTGYGGEQVLSTTLFRLYNALGGDDTTHLATQKWASRYSSFLIIKGIGTLTATTPNPEVFATALTNADLTELNFEGQVGGAVHKVVRWAFEKQGLYRPAGTPTPWVGTGDPPLVDVYIDDNSNGEYEYRRNFWNSTDIWNRLAPDGGSIHQTPVTQQTNYVYVRVHNRGTQEATEVNVRGFHCEPGTGLVWPDDWTAMTTAQLTAPAPIPSGGSTVIGPFEWTPEFVGHECLLMLADAVGDPANDSTVQGPIAHSRLVPFDNNIGQRNVAPVAGGGGLKALLESLRHRRFRVRNPYPWPVPIVIDPDLPEFLTKKGWGIRFENAGATKFRLPAHGSRQVVFSLTPGEDFTVAEAKEAGAAIEIVVYADGLVDGGMTYPIDARIKTPPLERRRKPVRSAPADTLGSDS